MKNKKADTENAFRRRRSRSRSRQNVRSCTRRVQFFLSLLFSPSSSFAGSRFRHDLPQAVGWKKKEKRGIEGERCVTAGGKSVRASGIEERRRKREKEGERGED